MCVCALLVESTTAWMCLVGEKGRRQKDMTQHVTVTMSSDTLQQINAEKSDVKQMTETGG